MSNTKEVVSQMWLYQILTENKTKDALIKELIEQLERLCFCPVAHPDSGVECDSCTFLKNSEAVKEWRGG